jgi:hypothetical protein
VDVREGRLPDPGGRLFGCHDRRSSSAIISYFGYLVIDDVYVYYKRPFVVTIESLTSGW